MLRRRSWPGNMAEVSPRRLLLLGTEGQLGRELEPLLAQRGPLVTSARSGGELPTDLTNPAALRETLDHASPDVIVNAAAYTAVDQAETQSAAAYRINRDAPAELARWAAEHDAFLLHFSTDYVFAGDAERPYRETDRTDPKNTYGASKLAGEAAIAAVGCRHLIFRTSWVYGRHGNNFVKTITRLAQQRDDLTIVDDQWGRPVAADTLAELSVRALTQALGEPLPAGIFHLTANGDPVTWYGFAQAFLKWWREQRPDIAFARPEPTSSDRFPTPAQRPAWSVLDNAKFESQFAIAVPGWREQMKRALAGFSLPS